MNDELEGGSSASTAAADAAKLRAEFARWISGNERGGWSTRWRRRFTWLAQLAQRLGLERVAAAPLFTGDRMRVVTGEEVSRGILTFGYTEVALTTLMLHALRPGDVFVDVGTHFGYEAMVASRLVGPAGRVVCFEPNPAALALARQNLSALANVELREVAVGATVGTMRFAIRSLAESAFAGAAAAADSGPTIEVPLTTLDDALGACLVAGRGVRRRVRLVKVDVEGEEAAVLAGARRLLADDTPLLVLEADIWTPGSATTGRAAKLQEQLRPFGYRGYTFERREDGGLAIAPLGERDVTSHANVIFAAPDEPLVDVESAARSAR